MINSYSIWRYFFIFLIFIVGFIYTLPNLYKEKFIVTIKNTEISNDSLINDVQEILKNNNIINKSILFESDQMQIHFFSEIEQLFAYEILCSILPKKYAISCTQISSVPNWLNLIQARPIKLGLDLKGGLYLIIRVDTKTTLYKFQEQYIDALRSILSEKIIPYLKIQNMANYEIEISFKNIIDRNKAMSCLSKIYNNNILILKNIHDCRVNVAFSKNYIFSMHEDIIKKNIVILHHRMNQLKIFNPIIQRYGHDCIMIELPGVQDITNIKKVLSNASSLELRLVNTNINTFDINNDLIPKDSEIKLDNNGNIVPLYKKIILTGDHIINSNISFDEYHRPQVNIFLDNLGSSILSKVTKHNIGQLIATLFVEYKDTGTKNSQGYPVFYKQEKVINIATIQSQLAHSFCISGINNLNEAQHLSSLLRMGSLASPVYIEEECVVGPVLGKRNINQGIIACGLGILVSIFFMIMWYRYFGLIAGAALVVNLILIISVMSLIPGFVLTMPSIASIVLTLSMAIDANVLINERIKEEMRQGKPIQYSIYIGYRKAFITIADANITTIITAIVLYLMSTGPIQGFAMTTIIGVGTSMFTSTIGTRAFVNLFYGKKYIDKISI